LAAAVVCWEVRFTTSTSPASVAAAVALARGGMEKRTKLCASTAATAKMGRATAGAVPMGVRAWLKHLVVDQVILAPRSGRRWAR